jgi:hypothetical protein
MRGESVSNGQFEDRPEARTALLQAAEAQLATEAEHLRAELRLSPSTAQILDRIKATMGMRLPSQDQTVFQTLYDRERDKAFNKLSSEMKPDEHRAFRDDFADLFKGAAPARKTLRLADNMWKQDAAADRRTREGSMAPYRGRPEIYERDVLMAFADSIASAAGLPQFVIGHHSEKTLDDAEKGSPLFETLVAAVRWAMLAAWQSAGAPGTLPPIVKKEGVLTAYKQAVDHGRPLAKGGASGYFATYQEVEDILTAIKQARGSAD